MHHDAGDGQVVVGGVGDGPVADLAVVAALFDVAGPALDETFGALEGWTVRLRVLFLRHGALGAPASGR